MDKRQLLVSHQRLWIQNLQVPRKDGRRSERPGVAGSNPSEPESGAGKREPRVVCIHSFIHSSIYHRTPGQRHDERENRKQRNTRTSDQVGVYSPVNRAKVTRSRRDRSRSEVGILALQCISSQQLQESAFALFLCSSLLVSPRVDGVTRRRNSSSGSSSKRRGDGLCITHRKQANHHGSDDGHLC